MQAVFKMGTFFIDDISFTPVETMAFQETTGDQFANDFTFELPASWQDFDLRWDATEQWPKLVMLNSNRSINNFLINSSPNDIVGNDVLLSPYSYDVNNSNGLELFLTSTGVAPTYTAAIDSVISADLDAFIIYFDSENILTHYYKINMVLHFNTGDPAFPLQPRSLIKFDVTRKEGWL